jgi:hypothetical protein
MYLCHSCQLSLAFMRQELSHELLTLAEDAAAAAAAAAAAKARTLCRCV